MKTLSCMIIDDEPLAVKLLESYVEKTPGITLASSHASAMQALDYLTQNKVDLIFCDIQMPDLNGLQFARILSHNKARIIFTTAFDQYALQCWDTEALHYLQKPIDYPSFMRAVGKAFRWYDMQEQLEQTTSTLPAAELPEEIDGSKTPTVFDDSFFAKSDGRLVRIRFRDINFIEGLRDYVKIHVEGRAHAVLSLVAMRDLEEILPTEHFLRIHRSFIINLDKMDAYERGLVVVSDKRIPVSDSYKDVLLEYLASRTLQARNEK